MSALEIGVAIIPILQMSKLRPIREAHSQLPKSHQLRTGITTQANSLRNLSSLVGREALILHNNKSKH